jgi:hypothetical protein
VRHREGGARGADGRDRSRHLRARALHRDLRRGLHPLRQAVPAQPEHVRDAPLLRARRPDLAGGGLQPAVGGAPRRGPGQDPDDPQRDRAGAVRARD